MDKKLKSIKSYIAEGVTDKVFPILLDLLNKTGNKELLNQVTVLSAQFSQLNKSNRIGVSSNNEIKQDLNKINYSILEIVNELESTIERINSELENELKIVLSNTIKRYADKHKLTLVKPFLDSSNLFSDSEILSEFLKVLNPSSSLPNYNIIEEKWKNALERIPENISFEEEVETLLYNFKLELVESEFEILINKNRDYIYDESFFIKSFDLQSSFNSSLDFTLGLLKNNYGILSEKFLKSPISIREKIYDSTLFIEEKTKGFTGREYVFDLIKDFIKSNTKGYLHLKADPGFGKSSIAAQLVKEEGYIHHFNVRSSGRNKPSDFITNICSQLIARYNLDYNYLPEQVTIDGSFLSKLLHEVSPKLKDNKCVIVVDAMDEVDKTLMTDGANILYLPRVLPENIYFILTSRREEFNLRIDINEQKELSFKQNEEWNLNDIRSYVIQNFESERLEEYVQSQRISLNDFVNQIVGKSQGNFIYVRMILPELKNGFYSKVNIEELPAGLNSYYDDHWNRMKMKNELDWFDYKLPIIVALTVIKESVPVSKIAEFSSISDSRRIRAVLKSFDQFIFKSVNENNEKLETSYRWYHASFFDFVSKKEEIEDERIDLIEANKKIADVMWKNLFDD